MKKIAPYGLEPKWATEVVVVVMVFLGQMDSCCVACSVAFHEINQKFKQCPRLLPRLLDTNDKKGE